MIISLITLAPTIFSSFIFLVFARTTFVNSHKFNAIKLDGKKSLFYRGIKFKEHCTTSDKYFLKISLKTRTESYDKKN